MKALEDLPTPAVLVDLDVLESNLRRMAERARGAGVKLRPHAKTHKILEIGRMQIAAGAAGLSLAKTSEAEVFATAGFEDIFLAYPIVGPEKARRLLALSGRVRLAAGVDSEEGAESLGEVFHAAGRRLDVLLKVDCGLHRVGVPPEGAARMAQRVAQLPGLSFRGLFTHAGHCYQAQTPEAVAEVGRSESQTLLTAACAVREAGVPVEEISVGSTPTARHAMAVRGVTECRPGNYVYKRVAARGRVE